MARLDPEPFYLPPFSGGDWRAAWKAQSAFLDELQRKSNALEPGKIVGGVVRWQRADGYAIYLVTKERPLTLQHVPYSDAYTVEPALIRGLTKQDILDMLNRERARRQPV